MKTELAVKQIYEDFISKVTLDNDEKQVLDMFLKNYSYIKIGDNIGMSDRNVGRVMRTVKQKYEKVYLRVEKSTLNRTERNDKND